MKRNPSPILSVDNLASSAKNAQKEAVKTVCLSFGNSLYHLENSIIVPSKNHSDLVLFAGEKIMPTATTKLFFSFGKKSPPLHKTITPAVIATINQFVDKVDLKTLDEIKTALSEVNEHFENVDNEPNPFGFDLSGGAL
jgi:thiamine pyrophosphate-dependent acetolactate synthase large subunit-like protein